MPDEQRDRGGSRDRGGDPDRKESREKPAQPITASYDLFGNQIIMPEPGSDEAPSIGGSAGQGARPVPNQAGPAPAAQPGKQQAQYQHQQPQGHYQQPQGQGPVGRAQGAPPSQPTGQKGGSGHGVILAGAVIGVLVMLGTIGGVIWFFVSSNSALPPAQVFKKAAPSVVRLVCKSKRGKSESGSAGSGFFVAPDIVATNQHVIGDQLIDAMANIIDEDARFPVKAVIYRDPDHDLALLYVPGTQAKPLELKDHKQVHVGDKVYALGSPGKHSSLAVNVGGQSMTIQDDSKTFEGTFTPGMVSSEHLWTNDEKTGAEFIQHTASISHGNSGGPLLNERGNVIGVNTLTMTESGEHVIGSARITDGTNHVKGDLIRQDTNVDDIYMALAADFVQAALDKSEVKDKIKELREGGSHSHEMR